METIETYRRMPTAGDSFGHGWNVMKKYFLILFLVVVVMGLIMAPTQFFRWNMNPMHLHDWRFGLRHAFGMDFGFFSVVVGLFILAYALLIIPVFKYGSRMIFIQGVRNTRPDLNKLVEGFNPKNYLPIILANLLVAALVIIGFVALIIPGIFIACRLAFVAYLVMDKGLDPIVAVEESWKKTRGHGWTILWMAVVSFFICIAGLCVFFVGIFPASIWVHSSFASLYDSVMTEKP